MNKIHFKHKIVLFRKPKKINIFIIILFFLLLTVIILFKLITKKVSPTILNYAEIEARKISTSIINAAITKNLSGQINYEELYIINKNNSNEINTIDFNPNSVNKILTQVTDAIGDNLKKLENGNIENLNITGSSYLSNSSKLSQGIIFEIPSGIIFNNTLLANLGPKVPVRLNLTGDIISEIETKITNYGINNALIELRIKLDITEQILLPITSNQIKISTSVPLTLKLIQGTVPNYYSNGMNNNSNSLAVPIE